MGLKKLREADGALAGDPLHSIIGAGKHAILIVFRDFLEVLP